MALYIDLLVEITGCATPISDDPCYEHVYISSHGDVQQKDEAYLKLPRARVCPEESPEDCFESAELVALSACSLGKAAFVDPVYGTDRRTDGCRPKEVEFIDSAIFFLNLFLPDAPAVTAVDYTSIAPEVSEKTRYRDLLDLVHRGLLEAVGAKKGRKYVLARSRPRKA